MNDKHPTLFPTEDPLKPWQTSARARNTDPGTSHAAARSIPSKAIRESQAWILEILKEHGPMTDQEIWDCGAEALMSTSGARTRRSELVFEKLVRDSGERKKLPSGRYSIVWEAVQ